MTIALALVCSMAKVSASVVYQIGGTADLEILNVSIDNISKNNILCGGIMIMQEGTPNSTMPANYVTVCTDIGATVYIGQKYTYDSPATPFSASSGVNPAWGTGGNPGSAAAAIQNAAYLFYNYGQLTSGGIGGSVDNMTALQLAVWDVLYDTTGTGKNSINGTRFTYSGENSTVQNDVTTWIAALNGNSKAGSFGYTGGLLYPDPTSGGVNANGNGEAVQELLIAVPEAPTVIAGALLLLPLGASTVRILNKRRAS